MLFNRLSIAATIVARSAGTSVNYGDTTIEATVDNGNSGLIFGIPFNLPAQGTLLSLSFYVETAAGNLVMGLYDATGAGGIPGALKGSTAGFVPTTGWQTRSVLIPVALAAGNYWVVVNPSSDALAFRKNPSASIGAGFAAFAYTGTLPATCPTPFTISSSEWSMYATFSVVLQPPVVTATTFQFSTPAHLGDNVGQITASNNPTSFAITAGNSASDFALDTSTGIVTIAAHGVTTYASGSGSTSLTVTASNAAGTSAGVVETVTFAAAGILPVGVTLRAIDGETMTGTVMSHTWYSIHGAVAASASFTGLGWDDPRFFPIQDDYCIFYTTGGGSNGDVSTILDLGLNASNRMNGGPGDNSSINTATNGHIWAIQAPISAGVIEGGTPNLASVGFHVEEPSNDPSITTTIANCAPYLNGRFIQITFSSVNLCNNNLSGLTLRQVCDEIRPTSQGNRRIDQVTGDFYFFSNSMANTSQLSNFQSLYQLPSQPTADQNYRGSNYGDLVDTYRFHGANQPGPITTYMDNTNGQFANNPTPNEITPLQWNWAVWSILIHGARYLLYFGSTGNTPPGTQAAGGFSPSTIAGQTTSLYKQAKVVHKFITNTAPILNSPYAIGYVSVTPLGYAFPNQVGGLGPKAQLGNNGIEIAAKWYQDGAYTPTSGPLNGFNLPNGFYIMACVRGSAAQTNIAATFTIANTGSTSVSVLNDAMFYGTLSGSTLTVTEVCSGSILRVGQTIYFGGSSRGTISVQTFGTAGSIGTYTVTGSGTVSSNTFGLGMRTISVTGGGTTFTDTFETSYTSRIYLVN